MNDSKVNFAESWQLTFIRLKIIVWNFNPFDQKMWIKREKKNQAIQKPINQFR